MARFQSFSQTFMVAAQQTKEAAHRILVVTAKREHARIMSAAPQPKSFARFVDGKLGAPEEVVKPHGVIVYRYPRMSEVVQFAMETLFDLSPVLSGEYRNAHTIFLNGAAVANLENWRPGDDITITNPLPYARKIEVGRMKLRVPGSDRVYQQAAKIVRGRFGNAASVTFTYRGIVGGAQVNPETAGPTVLRRTIVRGSGGRFTKGTRTVAVSGGAHNKSEARFPVLLIRER